MKTEFTGNVEEVKHIKDAIRQLDKLAKKLNIYVGGCGCCGSPYMFMTKNGNAGADYIKIGHNPYDEEDDD
jgi:hypothetical protein